MLAWVLALIAVALVAGGGGYIAGDFLKKAPEAPAAPAPVENIGVEDTSFANTVATTTATSTASTTVPF
jgi:hypothetical protein